MFSWIAQFYFIIANFSDSFQEDVMHLLMTKNLENEKKIESLKSQLDGQKNNNNVSIKRLLWQLN